MFNSFLHLHLPIMIALLVPSNNLLCAEQDPEGSYMNKIPAIVMGKLNGSFSCELLCSLLCRIEHDPIVRARHAVMEERQIDLATKRTLNDLLYYERIHHKPTLREIDGFIQYERSFITTGELIQMIQLARALFATEGVFLTPADFPHREPPAHTKLKRSDN